ncbi:hypothetical protein GA0070616_3220 [Micromonospora nigra]|uniref:DNA alkylation repair enzyme n=1 Tax=Micromonospora nigra TaxID=145857 RepID=A0A1C6S961_9ACTN|nr:hypothetical protein GA0070616_3220 [Micromonospora nigra]
MRKAVVEFGDDPGTLPWLRERATTEGHELVRRAAAWVISDMAGWRSVLLSRLVE